ncbi:MAG: Hsp70 family protein, partial [Candidatus Geothermarchaeales archaeon]
REEAEKAKIELSTVTTRDINLPFIASDASGPKNLTTTLSRATLEELVRPIVDKCRNSVQQALSDAKLTPQDVSKVILVGGPTRMPIVRQFVKSLVGKDPELGVDPMECVAMGAAIQGGVLAGEVKDILLLDVTPLSLGVETLGSVQTKIIDRNTTIPTKKTQTFSTAADNQTAVTINVLQGERSMAADNISLGTFNLEGIPPAPRGIPQIEVTFDIDANGILNVSAKDLATNKEQKITITASSKLSDEDKDRMVKDAEKFAEEDKRKKEEIDSLNAADSLIYTAERTKSELQDKMNEDQKGRLDKGLTELKEAVAAKNMDLIKSRSEELSKVLQEVGTAAYQEAAQKAAAQQAAEKDKEEKPGKEGKEKVVDADYKVVDEDKKPK